MGWLTDGCCWHGGAAELAEDRRPPPVAVVPSGPIANGGALLARVADALAPDHAVFLQGAASRADLQYAAALAEASRSYVLPAVRVPSAPAFRSKRGLGGTSNSDAMALDAQHRAPSVAVTACIALPVGVAPVVPQAAQTFLASTGWPRSKKARGTSPRAIVRHDNAHLGPDGPRVAAYLAAPEAGSGRAIEIRAAVAEAKKAYGWVCGHHPEWWPPQRISDLATVADLRIETLAKLGAA